MAIFMLNVSWNIDDKHVADNLVTYLHGPHFQELHPTRMNFHVFLHPDKRKLHRHNGTGILTLPNEETAKLFLSIYGSPSPRYPISVDRKTIVFRKSTQKHIRKDVQEKIMLPYQDRRMIEMRQQRLQSLGQGRVDINALQFGWECRDYVFSIESERTFNHFESASLAFEEDRREVQIKFKDDVDTYIIAMNYSNINLIYVDHYLGKDPVIVFALLVPPTYLRQQREETPNSSILSLPIPDHERGPSYERLSFLPIPDHERVAPFASLAIRVVCTSLAGLREFQTLCNIAQLRKVSDMEYPVDRRELFSALALARLERFLQVLNWSVAFQILSLLYGLVLDVQEILGLMGPIVNLCREHGKMFVSTLLRKFIPRAKQLYIEEDVDAAAILQCFRDTEAEMTKSPLLATLKPTEGSIYDAYHVIVTPTSMSFDGPHPERSNRVIRAYDEAHHESFLRVSFLDEAKLQYRFNRDIDGPGFIRHRVGPYLLNGLPIAGRTFKFLAYSQSALKEHSVWFVKSFRNNQDNRVVDARSIIKSLGQFDKVDKKLVYCPARYAARISQAFTATDSVEVEVEEILHINDVETADGKYQFTDGVGTMSTELAHEINIQLKENSRRRGRLVKSSKPSSYQIRFQGVKGMISTDYKLRGLTMCIRPSMTKFEADGWNNIEIARAFDRPGPYFLNRPLIMLLEGLGVPYRVFEKYQRHAVKETKQARDTLEKAANGLFDRYGLGAAFRISSVLHNLHKLGITDIPDSFYVEMLDDAIHHVLRDLKNHARIPVPGAWTLVGVADVHRYLGPNEIFACVKPANSPTIYLEGPILISRSPTIHPGDAMIVHAIGRPPPGSCFHAEPLANNVVFSIQGERPIPSCLGGGDLDGDVYNLIPLNDLPQFRPTKSHPPAEYTPATRMMLDHPSTMADVAEFVMEYINSDVVGIIATNWLLIADQSPEHIFDKDCMALANLHSDAVDYPKSGNPVALRSIPKPKLRSKPDWHAPETVDISTSADFYVSPRAIGRLFRDIDLPMERTRQEINTRTRPRRAGRRRAKSSIDDIGKSLREFNLDDHGADVVFATVEEYVEEFIDTRSSSEDDREMMLRLFEDFASTLKSHCITHTLSHAKTGQLSEAEAVVGTIMQRTSQRRKRKDMMAKLREDTDLLVRGIREELAGDDDISNEKYLERSWVAWELALIKRESKEFGAEAFWWVALGAIFDSIREIEEGKK